MFSTSLITNLCFVALGAGIHLALIRYLKTLKVYQIIYEHSPDHHQKKSKTPTLGGLAIIFTFLLGVIFTLPKTPEIIWITSLTLVATVIGFLDDYRSIKGQKNKGLTAAHKFLLQNLIAAIALGLYHLYIQPLTPLTFIFFQFLLVATPNATNLTDGLDGLLGGLSLITLFGFTYYFLSVSPEITQLTQIMMAAIFSFLIFNIAPAKIFMGDTGSLSIGTFFACLAIVSGTPLMLIPLGAVYIIETLSVIIQVLSFKIRKKRIFLMSPLHHHFELLGLKESHVVALFWGLGIAFLILFIVLK
jgi:phospho-N-acetylmuramoyl-pentapeptide-transferase